MRNGCACIKICIVNAIKCVHCGVYFRPSFVIRHNRTDRYPMSLAVLIQYNHIILLINSRGEVNWRAFEIRNKKC